MKNYTLLFLMFLTSVVGFAQQPNFTQQDTLRGSITPERVWWDLQHYTLDFNVTPATKSISGSKVIRYKVLDSQQKMQIDL